MTQSREVAKECKEKQGQELQVRSILERDLAWAAYALADLQPGFTEQCAWFVQDDGLVMLYHGLTPPILFAMGPADAVAVALESAAGAGKLPDAVYLSTRGEHEAAVGRWYDLSPAWDDRRPMVRMVLDGRTFVAAFVAAASAAEGVDRVSPSRTAAQAAATTDRMPLSRLTVADVSRLEALFAQGGDFAPDAFAAGQIDNGVFYGVEGPAGQLLASGGTHIVDWQAGVAALGNFYTSEGCRGKGYAGSVLNAVVRDLRTGGAKTIVLNVDQRNATARRLYQRHGFVENCAFVEGCVNRKIED